MHPVIKLTSFLLLVVGLTSRAYFFWIIIIPLFILLFEIHCSFSTIWPLLKRLRWLVLSIVVLYGWSLEFNYQEIFILLQKITNLIMILLAAHLLLKTTSSEEIMATLRWLSLAKNNLFLNKLSVRLALTLDTVKKVQNLYVLPLTAVHSLKDLGEKTTKLFTQIIAHADATPLHPLEIPDLTSPPWWQWFYPLFILLTLFS